MQIILDELGRLETDAVRQITTAGTLDILEELRVQVLGKKGRLTAILRGLKDLTPDQKRDIGGRANQLKSKLEELIVSRRDELMGAASGPGLIDVTLPGRPLHHGHRHLVTLVMDQIVNIFQRMGFEIADGPDIETDYYNFSALNFPPDHPARDEQDTFYVEGDRLLRTHTSGVQVREFEKRKPPVKIIAPGLVFRNEAVNARAHCVFHQVEGFFVDTNVTFSDLKGVLEAFVYEFFGSGVAMRYRPSFFPFTEPSAEVDIRCFFCGGKGCPICKNEGWLEILGSGMIDPAVLKNVGYDSERVSGYAFGMGVERPAMLRYQVNDIRLLFENDIRFIRQFR
ncbi:MAG: phenylalanine--tRNA ligase subunit alpha [candidate division Zixibacteria bacterium]|nr:phenylalanine--tRNA ligase subunit alpha [candidate division Zixibacteria bacterium]